MAFVFIISRLERFEVECYSEILPWSFPRHHLHYSLLKCRTYTPKGCSFYKLFPTIKADISMLFTALGQSAASVVFLKKDLKVTEQNQQPHYTLLSVQEEGRYPIRFLKSRGKARKGIPFPRTVLKCVLKNLSLKTPQLFLKYCFV